MTVCITTYNLVPNETSINKKLSITSICRMSAYCQTYKNVATVQDGNLGEWEPRRELAKVAFA